MPQVNVQVQVHAIHS